MEIHISNFGVSTGEQRVPLPDGTTEEQVIFAFTAHPHTPGPLAGVPLIFHFKKDVAHQICGAVLGHGRLTVAPPGARVPDPPLGSDGRPRIFPRQA